MRSTSSRLVASKWAKAAATPSVARKDSNNPIASSIASLVPEPMEKWAVDFASPSSTTLPIVARALRIAGKRRQLERLVISLCPARSSANTPSRKRADSASDIPSSPARSKVSAVVSNIQVDWPGSY